MIWDANLFAILSRWTIADSQGPRNEVVLNINHNQSCHGTNHGFDPFLPAMSEFIFINIVVLWIRVKGHERGHISRNKRHWHLKICSNEHHIIIIIFYFNKIFSKFSNNRVIVTLLTSNIEKREDCMAGSMWYGFPFSFLNKARHNAANSVEFKYPSLQDENIACFGIFILQYT